MVNNDILIKYSLKRLSEGHTLGFQENNWVDYTRFLKSQITICKLGFPGIGNNDLNIIPSSNIKIGGRYILDDNLDANCGYTDTDSAPLLGIIKNISGSCVTFEIEGIGAGTDFTRDPDRHITWGTTYEIDISKYYTLLEVTSTPRPDGGSVYYYFNKHTRDSRW